MANYKQLGSMKLRTGYYETEWGNTAVYKGGKTAFDLDAGERIPAECLFRFLRPLSKS